MAYFMIMLTLSILFTLILIIKMINNPGESTLHPHHDGTVTISGSTLARDLMYNAISTNEYPYGDYLCYIVPIYNLKEYHNVRTQDYNHPQMSKEKPSPIVRYIVGVDELININDRKFLRIHKSSLGWFDSLLKVRAGLDYFSNINTCKLIIKITGDTSINYSFNRQLMNSHIPEYPVAIGPHISGDYVIGVFYAFNQAVLKMLKNHRISIDEFNGDDVSMGYMFKMSNITLIDIGCGTYGPYFNVELSKGCNWMINHHHFNYNGKRMNESCKICNDHNIKSFFWLN
jgi:hypothetical protein